MNARGRRVDLRFGNFACSVQGFEDPVEPLARLLREFGTALADRAPELGPLFDEDTLRRLEAEIAGGAGGTVSATPGLVLTVAEPETAPAGAGESKAAPETAPEATPEPAAPEVGTGDDPPPASYGGTEEAHETGDRIGDDGATDREVDTALSVPEDLPASGEPAEPENLFGPPEKDFLQETDAPAGEMNLFDDEALGAAADETPAPPPWQEEPQPVTDPVLLEAELSETVNLFEADRGAEIGETGPNLFAEDEPDDTVQSPAGDGECQPEVDEEEAPGSTPLFRPGRSGAPLQPVEDLEPRRRPVVSVADLAKKSGASTPQELIVASAAWLVVVQGQHSFTRREVLEVFDEIPGDHTNSAEARIKGFGKLIRNAQVKLGADDRFRLSDDERDRFEMLLG